MCYLEDLARALSTQIDLSGGSWTRRKIQCIMSKLVLRSDSVDRQPRIFDFHMKNHFPLLTVCDIKKAFSPSVFVCKLHPRMIT
jgi:hypothetical protein